MCQVRAILVMCVLALSVSGCSSKQDDEKTPPAAHGGETGHKSMEHGKRQKIDAGDNLPDAGAKNLLSKAEAAITKAKKENKFLVAYFYKSKASLRKIDSIIEKARPQWLGKANAVTIEVLNPSEQEIVRKCGVTRVPFTTVVAPNGAITARAPGVLGPDFVERGFVSPKMAELLRIMQDDSVTFLCLVNESTKYGDEVEQTVSQAVHRLSGIAELVSVDPKDEREGSLLKQVNVAPDIDIATTLVIAPTGIIIEKFVGKITSRDLFDSFEKIMTMDGGCGAATATGGSACDVSAGVGGASQGCQ